MNVERHYITQGRFLEDTLYFAGDLMKLTIIGIPFGVYLDSVTRNITKKRGGKEDLCYRNLPGIKFCHDLLERGQDEVNEMLKTHSSEDVEEHV